MIARVRDMVECARHGHTWSPPQLVDVDGHVRLLFRSCARCGVDAIAHYRGKARRRRLLGALMIVLLVALLGYGALAMLDALLGWTSDPSLSAGYTA